MITPTFAEEAVLGAVMLDNAKLHEVAPILGAGQFTSPLRARVWEALKERVLAGEPADHVTIGELLPDDFSYVYDLASNTPSSASVKTYAEIVRGNWKRRQASVIAASLMSRCREGDESAVDEAIGSLLALNATVTECDHTLKQALKAAFLQVQTAYENGGQLPGITTGLSKLDEILGGWHPGDLAIIGARPSMGKTALMVNLAEAAAKAGYNVGIISAEQPAEQIGLRTISLESRVGAADLRRGRVDDDAWARVNVAIAAATTYKVRIYDRSAITLDELVSVARKWKHAHGLQILFLDYAQRVTVPGADRITEVSAVARGLKNLARDLSIPLVALAQVKATVDSREDKRPNAGDLANSDELTREADEIVMLYREAVYYQSVNERKEPVRERVAELLIEKNRHGPTGYCEAAFLPETMRFGDLERGGF